MAVYYEKHGKKTQSAGIVADRRVAGSVADWRRSDGPRRNGEIAVLATSTNVRSFKRVRKAL